jgi:hypothetical protein
MGVDGRVPCRELADIHADRDQSRDGDAELAADVRRLVDARPTMDTGGSPRSSIANGDPAACRPSTVSGFTG